MCIVNFLGHGFQWWQDNAHPNPAPFVVPKNCEIRFYVEQSQGVYAPLGADGGYDANRTAPIIVEELDGQFQYLVRVFSPGDRCPEHLFINEANVWNDIFIHREQGNGPFNYIPGRQFLEVNGLPLLTLREFGPQENIPIRFQHNRQFACSPDKTSMFTLSWLANHMRDMLIAHPLFDLEIDNHEHIILRWLVCREMLIADNLDLAYQNLRGLVLEEREQQIDQFIR